MSRVLATAVAVVVLAGCGETRPQADQTRFRVGEVIIIGNTVTPDYYIRERLEIYPGQLFSAVNLLKTEWALALAGLDMVAVLAKPNPYDRDIPFWDVEIHVRETPLTYLAFGSRNTCWSKD